MKRRLIFRIVITALSILLIMVFYLNSNYFIEKQEWKHRDGSSVGDWIKFDNVYYSIEGKTIYKKSIASGEVVFCLGKMLIIKEIATGEKGYYINKTSF